MKAIRQYEFGGPDVLRMEDVPDLEPQAGHVRIAVRASGVHVVDTLIRAGTARDAFPLPELPMTPGREVAGRIDATGRGVDASWAGKRVVVHLAQASGGYAEQALASVGSLHEIPTELAYDTAVAAIGTGRTAAGIVHQVAISADDVVLVTAAAGGLGSLLLQAVREAGARSIALAGGPAKVAIALEQGADVAVDYRVAGWDEDLRRALGGNLATLVLDGVGGEEGLAAFGMLAPGGVLMQYGWTAGKVVYEHEDKTVETLLGPRMLDRPGGLRSLETEALRRAADGTRVPLVGRSFPLSEAGTAHERLSARETFGKVVLIPDVLL